MNIDEIPNRAPAEAITDELGELEILLVLDNCEHVVGACAELAYALLDGTDPNGIWKLFVIDDTAVSAASRYNRYGTYDPRPVVSSRICLASSR